jgi:hypothetical protein
MSASRPARRKRSWDARDEEVRPARPRGDNQALMVLDTGARAPHSGISESSAQPLVSCSSIVDRPRGCRGERVAVLHQRACPPLDCAACARCMDACAGGAHCRSDHLRRTGARARTGGDHRPVPRAEAHDTGPETHERVALIVSGTCACTREEPWWLALRLHGGQAPLAAKKMTRFAAQRARSAVPDAGADRPPARGHCACPQGKGQHRPSRMSCGCLTRGALRSGTGCGGGHGCAALRVGGQSAALPGDARPRPARWGELARRSLFNARACYRILPALACRRNLGIHARSRSLQTCSASCTTWVSPRSGDVKPPFWPHWTVCCTRSTRWGLPAVRRPHAARAQITDADYGRLPLMPGGDDSDFDRQLPYVTLHKGSQLLSERASQLLGPASADRSTRIMVGLSLRRADGDAAGVRTPQVTMPSEAATDGGALIKALLNAGMSVVRINCAHDSPAAVRGSRDAAAAQRASAACKFTSADARCSGTRWPSTCVESSVRVGSSPKRHVAPRAAPRARGGR